MSTGISTENLINDQLTFTVITGTLDSDTPIENVAHPHGFRTARFTPSGGVAAFEVDLGSQASRDLVGLVGNVNQGSIVIKLYDSVPTLVQTINMLGSFPFFSQMPNRGSYVKPSVPFQTIRFEMTPATGDNSPVEVFHAWCGDVVELPNPALPWDRNLVGLADLVAERGRPLTSQVISRYDMLRKDFATIADALNIWDSADFGCKPVFVADSYSNRPLGSGSYPAGQEEFPAGLVALWEGAPRLRAIRPFAESWSINTTFSSVPGPRYPDKYEVVTF